MAEVAAALQASGLQGKCRDGGRLRARAGLVQRASGRADSSKGEGYDVSAPTEYTEGVCGDGAAILRDGQPMPITEILARLKCAEYYQRRANERGADMEHMLEVMRFALDSLVDDNDSALAAKYLRTCLRKFGR
jgi:hypothetical protein